MLQKACKPSSLVLLIFFLLVGSGLECFSQTQTNNYDIVLAGFTIGSMKADKTTASNGEDYQLHSKVEFWFFGKIHVEFLQKAHYENGQLMKANTNSDSNRGNFVTTVVWNKDHYDVDANSYKFHNEEPINQVIKGSTILKDRHIHLKCLSIPSPRLVCIFYSNTYLLDAINCRLIHSTTVILLYVYFKRFKYRLLIEAGLTFNKKRQKAIELAN